MKALTTVLTICLLGCFTACQGQVKKETTEVQKELKAIETDSSKSMNLLDEQTKMFNQVFTLAGAGEDNPLGGATNYLELIEKMDMPEEQKQQLRDMYELYDTSLDPKKKEELKLKVNKMMQEGMEKGMVDPQ